MFYLFYAFIWLITWLPLRVLYLISDILFPVIYYVVRYRRAVVRQNLQNSFPEKSEKEILKIERRFYRFFCDLFIETMYQLHMSENEMRRRFDPGNLDAILEQYEKGKSVMLMTAHYCNWEWASSISLSLPDDKPLYNIYRKLTNEKFGEFTDKLRLKFGSGTIEMKKVLRTILKQRSEGKLICYGMISDQSPRRANIHYWTNFLNQNSPVLIGTEELAKKFDFPVIYIHIARVKRGYYECEYYPVELTPKETSEFEITEKYIRILEQKIQEVPEYYLWTHKRWKHKQQAPSAEK